MRFLFASSAALAAVGVLGLLGAACGSSTGTTPPVLGAAPSDAGTGTDTNAPLIIDPNYPAAHAPLPQVDYNGGAVLSAVKVITVTFDGDPMRADLESFGDTITQSSYWSAVTSEYCAPPGSGTCIGPGATPDAPHVHIAAPASATYDDASDENGPSSIASFISKHVLDGSFPTPDANTLYAIYFPTGTTVTLDGTKSCQDGGFAGYHKTTKVTPVGAGTIEAVYAIVPRCTLPPKTELETVTSSASHELVEAVTDPYITANSIAYDMRDAAWSILGGEVADVCLDLTQTGLDDFVEGAFTVQRSWSNLSARAGHNPCVPIPAGEVYFNLAPEVVGGQSSAVMQLSVGGSATIEATAFSDGPTDTWQVKGVDFTAATQGTAPALAFAFDTPIANNGTKVKITVTLTSAAQDQARTSTGVVNVQTFFLESKQVSATGVKTVRLWPGLVIQK